MRRIVIKKKEASTAVTPTAIEEVPAQDEAVLPPRPAAPMQGMADALRRILETPLSNVGAVTGRMSSATPNMSGIPRDLAYGRDYARVPVHQARRAISLDIEEMHQYFDARDLTYVISFSTVLNGTPHMMNIRITRERVSRSTATPSDTLVTDIAEELASYMLNDMRRPLVEALADALVRAEVVREWRR